MIDNGQSVRSVAQALGVAESQLHKWKRQSKLTRAVGESEVAELTKKLGCVAKIISRRESAAKTFHYAAI